jgi:hypothetical protein
MTEIVQPATSGLEFGVDNRLYKRVWQTTIANTTGDFTKHRNKITLQERHFLTVPYLGRGKHDVDTETQMWYSTWQPNRKSTTPFSKGNYMERHETPMIDSIKNSVSNPKFLVEETVHKNWRRGGESSRDLARNYS